MTHDPQELGFEEPHTNTREYQGDTRLHSDADYLRRLHGMPKFDPRTFDYQDLAPNLFVHTWEGGRDMVSGGSSCFITGPEGAGKSTLFLRISSIEMEQNDARVVWRGVTGSRSEWLPFAPVTRICLPKGYEATARLVPKTRSRTTMGKEVPLDEVVREVVHYSDVMDLNLNKLKDGMFHVVYPDPKMRGCQWVYEESDRVVANASDEVKFTGDHDPVDHWWFGWGLSLVERGPFPWTTWMCDEVQSLAPEGAANDKYGTHLKVKLLGEAIEDMRKNGISRYFAGHKDKHLHNLIRDRVRWRICTNGTANPRQSRQSSIPVGFETVPMHKDMTTDMDIGEGLLYNENHFEAISWPYIPKPVDGDLKVFLQPKGDAGGAAEKAGVSL